MAYIGSSNKLMTIYDLFSIEKCILSVELTDLQMDLWNTISAQIENFPSIAIWDFHLGTITRKSKALRKKFLLVSPPLTLFPEESVTRA